MRRLLSPKIFLPIIITLAVVGGLGVLFSQAQVLSDNYLTENNSLGNNITSPNLSLCNYFTFSAWGECIDNKQSRSVIAKYPENCVGGVVTEPLERDCCVYDEWYCQWTGECLDGTETQTCRLINDCASANTPAAPQNRACQSSVLPTCQYLITWSGVCDNGSESQRIEKTYPSPCFDTSPVLEKRACTVNQASLKDCGSEAWLCSDWSPTLCAPSISRKRTCVPRPECILTNRPSESELCPNTVLTATSTLPICDYNYSDWAECVNGQQSRLLLGIKNSNCQQKTQPILTQNCIVEAKCLEDEWECEDWSACSLDGKQNRKCVLKFDCPEILSSQPLTFRSCTAPINNDVLKPAPITVLPKVGEADADKKNTLPNTNKSLETTLSPSADKVLEKTPSPSNEPKAVVNKSDLPKIETKNTSSTSENFFGQSREQAIIKSSSSPISSEATPTEPKLNITLSQAEIQRNLPKACLSAGYTNPADCESYWRQLNIVEECLQLQKNTKSACRDYLLQKYKQPLKCQNLNQAECGKLIDEVFLADLQSSLISNESKDALIFYQNNSAVLDTTKHNLLISPEAKPENVVTIKLPSSPLASSAGPVDVRLIKSNLSAGQTNLSPVVLVLDADKDGLPDDMEKRYGTNINNPDTDGDGYNDALEIKTGYDPLLPGKKSTVVLADVEKAILDGQALEQPKFLNSTNTNELKNVKVGSVKNEQQVKNNIIRFEGQAVPGQIVTVYIYSSLPIVVTVATDANGNWVYDLDKPLADGKHEVYVAINNDAGKISDMASPTAFLIKEAKAVTVDDFVNIEDVSIAPDASKNMITYYLLGGVAVLIAGVALFWVIKTRWA